MQTITLLLCAMAATTTAQSTPINHACSDADLITAITPVALTSATTLNQCAKDTGLSIEAVPVPANVTPAQVNALLQSSSCAAFYASIQSAIAKISPACYLVTTPVPVTSAQIMSVPFKDYVMALQGSATGAPGMTTTTKPSTTTAPTGNSTAAPGSSTTAPGSSTVAPGGTTLVPGNSTTAPGNSTTAPGNSTASPITDTVVTKTPSSSAAVAPATTTPKATSSASIVVPTLATLAFVAAAVIV
ncbi:hypothetical protein SDRG_16507 [Saprolegnia diclina VS20]|uniref:Secreted protein n=1 Tax=Saprolegnia diclina (strain VS20) TaxID=1156394 RepID=T0PTQ6_SAPDV|nr:hypothetical protein SDRG_16507 [Saprolegnia diclina VS20]EQC25611.1 hypothetical protein SDRG_16507 [Saprolegnia diclina VS20]|eukprot:XP_008620943.1 hypothetical protein SDRG_16507 [Saprolegnia diclina VS20]